MVELEADDALASAARIAAADTEVEQVCIWSPDKDLGQCVRGDRVVQVDRRADAIRDAAGVREKFGVDPALIPDLLALVGDSADGYPGIKGIGKVGAARMLNQLRADRVVPAGGAGRRAPRAGAAVQGPGDAAHATSSCSRPSTTCAGRARPRRSRRWRNASATARLLERSLAAPR